MLVRIFTQLHNFHEYTSHLVSGAIVEVLNGTSFIAMRSIMSKLVPPDELGRCVRFQFLICTCFSTAKYVFFILSYTHGVLDVCFFTKIAILFLQNFQVKLTPCLEYQRH